MDDYFTDVCDMQEVDGVALFGGRHTGRTQRMVTAIIRAANAAAGSGTRIYVIAANPSSYTDINNRLLMSETLTRAGYECITVSRSLVEPPRGAHPDAQFFWDHLAYHQASESLLRSWREFSASRGLTWNQGLV